MSEEGYLQIKIREQNEKTIGLKNEIKQLEIKIKSLENKFNQSIFLMESAMDMIRYKKELEKAIKDSSGIAFQRCMKEGLKTYDRVYCKHFSSIQSVLENHDERIQDNLSFSMAIVKILHIQPEDLEETKKRFKEFWNKEIEGFL